MSTRQQWKYKGKYCRWSKDAMKLAIYNVQEHNMDLF